MAHHDLAWYFGFGNNTSRLAQTKNFGKRLLHECTLHKVNKVFLSSEVFEYYSDINLLKGLKQEFSDFDIKVLVYLRRQDKFFQSSYKQVVKLGYTKSFTEYFHELNINYEKLLDDWSLVFGKENLKIKIFDDPEVKSNLLQDLLKTLEIKNLSTFTKEDFVTSNESFSNEHTALIRQLNLRSTGKLANEIFTYFETYYKQENQKIKEGELINKQQLIKLYNENKEINERIRHKYLPHRPSLFNWDVNKQIENHTLFDYIWAQPSALDIILYAVNSANKQA